MRAMLVAAGLGTRLRPLTLELPKPAVPIANRPVALYALEHLARAGISDVIANTHHLAAELRAELEPVCPSGMQLRFAHEPQILGTGGGVRNAWQTFGVVEGEDLLVVNPKLVFAPDLARALHAHRTTGAIATMVLRALPEGSAFAAVEHDADGRVRRIRGMPAEHQEPLMPAMYTGVQILSSRAIRDLPRDGDIIQHAYLKWLARGDRVQSVLDDAPWLDVGVSVPQYLQANLSLARGEVRWPGITPDARSCIIHPRALVPESATLRECILGANAQVPEGAKLERVVAWPNSQLPLKLHDAIVTPSVIAPA